MEVDKEEKNVNFKNKFEDYFKINLLESINNEIKVDSKLYCPKQSDVFSKFLSRYNYKSNFKDNTAIDVYPLIIDFKEEYTLDFLSQKFRLTEFSNDLNFEAFKLVANDHLNDLAIFLKNFYSSESLKDYDMNPALQVSKGKQIVDFLLWDINDLSKEYDLVKKLDSNYPSLLMFIRIHSTWVLNWKNLANYIKSLNLPKEIKLYLIFIVQNEELADYDEDEEGMDKNNKCEIECVNSYSAKIKQFLNTLNVNCSAYLTEQDFQSLEFYFYHYGYKDLDEVDSIYGENEDLKIIKSYVIDKSFTVHSVFQDKVDLTSTVVESNFTKRNIEIPQEEDKEILEINKQQTIFEIKNSTQDIIDSYLKQWKEAHEYSINLKKFIFIKNNLVDEANFNELLINNSDLLLQLKNLSNDFTKDFNTFNCKITLQYKILINNRNFYLLNTEKPVIKLESSIEKHPFYEAFKLVLMNNFEFDKENFIEIPQETIDKNINSFKDFIKSSFTDLYDSLALTETVVNCISEYGVEKKTLISVLPKNPDVYNPLEMSNFSSFLSSQVLKNREKSDNLNIDLGVISPGNEYFPIPVYKSEDNDDVSRLTLNTNLINSNSEKRILSVILFSYTNILDKVEIFDRLKKHLLGVGTEIGMLANKENVQINFYLVDQNKENIKNETIKDKNWYSYNIELYSTTQSLLDFYLDVYAKNEKLDEIELDKANIAVNPIDYYDMDEESDDVMIIVDNTNTIISTDFGLVKDLIKEGLNESLIGAINNKGKVRALSRNSPAENNVKEVNKIIPSNLIGWDVYCDKELTNQGVPGYTSNDIEEFLKKIQLIKLEIENKIKNEYSFEFKVEVSKFISTMNIKKIVITLSLRSNELREALNQVRQCVLEFLRKNNYETFEAAIVNYYIDNIETVVVDKTMKEVHDGKCQLCGEEAKNDVFKYYCYWCDHFICYECGKKLSKLNQKDKSHKQLINCFKSHNLILLSQNYISNPKEKVIDSIKLGDNMNLDNDEKKCQNHNALCENCQDLIIEQARFACMHCNPGIYSEEVGLIDYCEACIEKDLLKFNENKEGNDLIISKEKFTKLIHCISKGHFFLRLYHCSPFGYEY